MFKTTGMFNIAREEKILPIQQNNEVVVTVSGGNKPSFKSKKYDKTEIDTLLREYVLLPQKSWKSLDRGIHIRYIRNDGRFVRGGFVTGYSSQNGRNLLTLANGFNAAVKGYSAWTIALDSIKYLYIKKDKLNMVSTHDNIASKSGNEIENLKKTVYDMQLQLAALKKKAIKK
jgi:hypothetical protein